MVIPVWAWMFKNFSKIPKYISEGKLDMILTKPMDSQFLVSFTEFSLTTIISNLILGSLFVYIGIKTLSYTIPYINYVVFAWSIIPMVILIYSTYFLTVSIALYFNRLNNIHYVFTSFFDATRYPQEIYNLILQRIFISIIPIAIMVVTPAQTLFGRINILQLVWFHLLAAIFLLMGRFVWQKGLHHYSSASS